MQRRSGGRNLGAVLFTDIVGSTAIAAEMGNTRWSELVARHHRIVRRVIGRFGGHEVDTAGDGFFVSFERPADAIRAAVEATDAIRELGIEIRASVGFGELETVSGKPGGLVVNATARVMNVAGPGEVLVPASLRDLVLGAEITFAAHGVHTLKGMEGEFHLLKVASVDGKELPPPQEPPDAAERRREIFPAARRPGPLVAGLAAGALAVIVGASILLFGQSDEPLGAPGSLQNAVAGIDPVSGEILSIVDLGRGPVFLDYIDHPLAAGEGGVWVLVPPQLLHIDPMHADIRTDQIAVGGENVETGLGAVWVLGHQATVFRVSPATDRAAPFFDAVELRVSVPHTMSIADAVWIGLRDGTLVRVDGSTGEPGEPVETGHPIDRLAASKDTVWLVDILAGEVFRIDAASLQQTGQPIRIEGSVDQIVAGGDSLWVLDRSAGTVSRIDATSGVIQGPWRVGDDPTDMALGLDSVWVADLDGSVYRLDPLTFKVERMPIGAEVLGVAVDEAADSLWVYVGATVDTTGG
jgi:class 3 adenylate cyclase